MINIRHGILVVAVAVGGAYAAPQARCGDGGCGNGDCGGGSCGEPGAGCVVEVPSGPVSTLTKRDRKEILFMHEEEKLARDVYRHLGKKWDLRPFQNIQRSEQAHVDAMQQLIDRYDLTARSASADEGVFANRELQALYTKLVADGEASETAALRVGAYVEEVDIEDLDRILAKTQNEDLKQVAENLRFASCNHLRAFVRNLSRRDQEYVPTVLAPKVYDAIIGTETARGRGR